MIFNARSLSRRGFVIKFEKWRKENRGDGSPGGWYGIRV